MNNWAFYWASGLWNHEDLTLLTICTYCLIPNAHLFEGDRRESTVTIKRFLIQSCSTSFWLWCFFSLKSCKIENFNLNVGMKPKAFHWTDHLTIDSLIFLTPLLLNYAWAVPLWYTIIRRLRTRGGWLAKVFRAKRTEPPKHSFHMSRSKRWASPTPALG